MEPGTRNIVAVVVAIAVVLTLLPVCGGLIAFAGFGVAGATVVGEKAQEEQLRAEAARDALAAEQARQQAELDQMRAEKRPPPPPTPMPPPDPNDPLNGL